MTISAMSKRQRWLVLLALVLTWPALVNGSAFFFSDTTTYIRSADAIAFRVTHRPTLWSDAIARADGAAPLDPASPAPVRPSSFGKNIIIGRSIVYGLLLYLGVALGNLAIPIMLQALIAGAALIGSVRHQIDPAAAPRRFARTVLAVVALAAVTSLPFFVSFLMPDVFAGLAILAAVTVMTGWDRETRPWRLFWFALLSFGALMHTSHVLILLGLALCACIIRSLPRARAHLSGIGIAIVAVSACVGIAGDTAFALGIGSVLHRAPIRPPFLAMRLIADGPGAAYLRETCPASGFALCAYRDRPAASSEVLLWSSDPRVGIFTASSAGDQQRLAREQPAFAAAVVARYPGWTATTFLRNVGLQLGSAGLAEFDTPVLADREVAARIPRPVRDQIARSTAERGGMPTGLYRWLIWPVVLLATGVLLVSAWRGGWRLGVPIGMLFAGILLNAMICGGLSVPTERYQDRVIWLLPVCAVFLRRDDRWWRSGMRPRLTKA